MTAYSVIGNYANKAAPVKYGFNKQVKVLIGGSKPSLHSRDNPTSVPKADIRTTEKTRAHLLLISSLS